MSLESGVHHVGSGHQKFFTKISDHTTILWVNVAWSNYVSALRVIPTTVQVYCNC